MGSRILGALLGVSVMFSAAAYSAAEVGPREVVVQVVSSLKTAVNKHDAEKDPEAVQLLTDMRAILEPVVDFGFIARVVMGPAAKTATPQQIARFGDVFRDSLVSTYAKGMTGYVEAEMNIPPLGPEAAGQNRVAVRQEVTTASGVQIIDYTMAKNRTTGEWKLINVVLNGINLGKTFRSQFAQAHKQHGGDIDKVIASWAQVPPAKP
ncbi:MlaC/ttg2D family ABC transporter substrate-binding protein [Simiduia aestuariiviva]|uniref:Phospholipid transport system substrate-binding protein n=1 Tax=Simiduia aestuariiviva TaxID=1510459 RepID=A0A839URQ2_9GAMM|nr:ABC transporter substrate-binding protein [Simiduia aestuariiviva]MBB3169149.1 phospholipid transport system substrate-binding protein [Simiduia aestuariiviva]